MALLEIDELSVDFASRLGVLQAVDAVSLRLERSEVLGLVGESGSGKSVAMMALMGLIAYPGRMRARRMVFDGHDLLALPARQRRRLIGKDISMIFQDPSTCLNPCFTVGFHLTEPLREHLGMDSRAARRRAIELLEMVGIPAPQDRLKAYPHQLSGGMSQRVMIAMAIACKPKLLIADEPTTALDLTIQAQILDLLRDIQRSNDMAMVLITHNMGVVAEMADSVSVMYAGQIMEHQSVDAMFQQAQHPYTSALLSALPERGQSRSHLATIGGMVPGMHDRPAGCLFAPRCERAQAQCDLTQPELRAWQKGQVRCAFPLGDDHPERVA